MSQTLKNIVVLILLLSPLACKEAPPAPQIPGPPTPKDPRTFTWTVDTLAYPGSFQTFMFGMWASSDSDVYVVGHNDQPGPGTMFHYNGKRWSTTGFHAAEGGPIDGPVDLASTYGFSQNDVWVAGGRIYVNPMPPPNFIDSSLIIHYDGHTWAEAPIVRGGYLQAVWGIASNDIWAAGLGGTIYHFDGNSWIKIAFSDSSYFSSLGGLSSSDVYGIAYKFNIPRDIEYYYVWHWDGGAWSLQDIDPQTYGHLDNFGTDFIRAIGSTLFSSGTGLYQRIGSVWDRILPTMPTGSIDAFAGISVTKMFLVGDGSGIYYYDGTTVYRYSQFTDPGVGYYGVWTNGNEVLCLGTNGTKSYVLHGK